MVTMLADRLWITEIKYLKALETIVNFNCYHSQAENIIKY